MSLLVSEQCQASALAVEMRHLRRGVARARGGSLRHRAFDCGDVSGAQVDVEGAERLRQAVAAAQGPDIVPLVGARRRDRLAEALGALDVALSAGDIAAIERAVPKNAAAGSRYAAQQMAHLDSER